MNTKKLHKFLGLSLVLLTACSNSFCQVNAGDATPKIRYTSFTINSASNGIMVDWSTDSSVQVNYFEIQRSTDGKDFKTVAMILGPDPKEASGDRYDWLDKSGKKNKKYFYRLKHVSVDGESELSETKELALK